MKITEILLKDIEIDKNQPRKDIKNIGELANTIAKEGLIYPIEVIGNGKDGYKLIDGERRLRAFKLLNKKRIPCIVRTKVKNTLVRQLITDFQKDKLSLIEQSDAIIILQKQGFDKEDITSMLGIGNTKYYLLRRINGLNVNTRKKIIAGKITQQMLSGILRHDIEKGREDEIIESIIRKKLKTIEGINKEILKKQDIFYNVMGYLRESYVFERRTDDMNTLLSRYEYLIDEEINNAIKSNEKNLERELDVINKRIGNIIEKIKKTKNITNNSLVKKKNESEKKW